MLGSLTCGVAGPRHVAVASRNTILQFLELDNRHFAMAADRTPEKWGLSTVATNIPIVSEEESRAQRPDYLFVLPWHLRDAFVARESDYLRAGGRMLFPLPGPVVVGTTGGRLSELSLVGRDDG